MKLKNDTPFLASWVPGFLPDGREVVTVVIKGSFSLRRPDELHHIQHPPLESDEFGADPACNAPVRENDFAIAKRVCDVLIYATAVSPGSRPRTSFEVIATVGSMSKRFNVVGHREWSRSFSACKPSTPEPFVRHRISYDNAFGGIDIDPDQPDIKHTFLANPAGLGYFTSSKRAYGKPLPRTEEVQHTVTQPDKNYVPQAFGPLARHWAPRVCYAGTYDRKWQEERLPFLPDDFDMRFYQVAPQDQQIGSPVGGERIELINLTEESILLSRVPARACVVSFITHTGNYDEHDATCDGITIEPDEDLLTMTWRASVSLRRDLFELREILVTEKSRHSAARTRAKARGKEYFPGLGALVAKRSQGQG